MRQNLRSASLRFPRRVAASFNGEHEPLEPAATDSLMRTDRTGCLRLAQCSVRRSAHD